MSHWAYISGFEGWFYRIRFHPDAGFWRRLLQDPNGTLANAELAFRNGVEWLPRRPLPAALAHERDLNGGHVSEAGTPLTRCAGDTMIRDSDPTWLSYLRNSYGINGTHVLIDVTPMPPCDEGLPFYRAHLSGLIDNTVDTLPIGDYNSSGRLHTNDLGTAAFSERIADQLVAVIHSRATPRGGK
jgi:hypothetical protein